MATTCCQHPCSVSTEEVPIEQNTDWFAEHQKQAKNQVKLVLQAKKTTTRHNISKSLEAIGQNLNPNGRDPLQIFPEEVWLMIFKQVTDTSVLFQASRASHVFGEILNKWEYVFHVVFPFIEKWLHLKDVLVCRQVSVKWRRAVDNHIENYLGGLGSPANPEWPYDYYMADIDDWFRYEIGWKSEEKQVITRVPNKPHETNPFIGRLVSFNLEPMLYEDEEEDDEDNFTNVHTFFENVGVHIWHLDFHNCPDGDFFTSFKSADHCYLTFRKILQNCPNLKTFYFKQYINATDYLEWKDTSLQDELPHLPFLEELSIAIAGPNEEFRRFENKLVEKFLQKYSNQLERLSVGSWNTTILQFCSFKKLEQLEICSYREEKHKDLLNLLNVNAKNLKHLAVSVQRPCEDYWSRDNNHRPYFQALLRVCNHFPKLCRLNLEIEGKVDEIRDDEIASLPRELVCSTSVTNLTLKLEDLKIPYSFLVCFPVLKQLKIRFSEKPEPKWCQKLSDLCDEKLGAISVGMYLLQHDHPKHMYLSNLWEVLPLLKILKVEWKYPEAGGYIYGREGYQAEKIPWRTKADHQIFMAQQEAVRLKSMGIRELELRSRLKDLSTQITAKTNPNWFYIGSNGDPMGNKKFRKMIFPILCTHLGKPALLNCRLVNKQWKKVVDKIIANWNCANMRYQKNMEPFNDTYWFVRKPLIPNATRAFKTPLSRKGSLKLDQYKECPKANPFLGRTVGFRICSPAYGDRFYDMYDVFRNHGQYIHHLQIFAGNKGIHIDSTAYHELCYKIVKQLKFLKSLSFYNLDIRIPFFGSGTRFKGDFSKLRNNSLEKLTFISQNEHSLEIEPWILNKFAKKIKILYCTALSLSRYQPSFFDSLLELKLMLPLRTNDLNNMRYMQAPNLENLQLTLAGGVGHYKSLVLLARHFPSLVQLKLKFLENDKSILNTELENCPTGLLVCTKLRWLIVKSYENIISYDFLCLFPFVKKLTIRHEMPETKETENANCTDRELETDDEPSQRTNKQNITRLAEYLQLDDINEQSKMLIYKSNIWEIMLNLQDLEIKSENRAGSLTKTLFTREKYISLNCK